MNPIRKALAALYFCSGLIMLPAAGVQGTEMAPKSVASNTGTISGDIFGKKARWIHGYLSLYGAFDDNIFNTEKETESDLITVISPGIQLTVPGTDQPSEAIVSDTTTPGGLTFGRFTERAHRRFKAYVGYAPWFHFYADNTDQNVVNHYAQAGLQYNLRGGLSFDMVNRFVKDYDRLQANRSTQIDQYYCNVCNLIVTYPLSPKFLLRTGYTNNYIDYIDDEINGYRDRSDNSGEVFVFFKFRPKTVAFGELRYTDIDYDSDNDRDGDQQNGQIGLIWDITAKTSGSFRAGYGKRHYDAVFEDSDRFTFAGSLDYRFSPKMRVDLSLYHRNEESTELLYDNTLTSGAALTFKHVLRHNLEFEFELSYRIEDYQGGDAELLALSERSDDVWTVTPSLTYALGRWLSGSVAYLYRARNSNEPLNSFNANVFFIKLAGSI
jgi:hypothetical protein